MVGLFFDDWNRHSFCITGYKPVQCSHLSIWYAGVFAFGIAVACGGAGRHPNRIETGGVLI